VGYHLSDARAAPVMMQAGHIVRGFVQQVCLVTDDPAFSEMVASSFAVCIIIHLCAALAIAQQQLVKCDVLGSLLLW
jgi:hypothetical protein